MNLAVAISGALAGAFMLPALRYRSGRYREFVRPTNGVFFQGTDRASLVEVAKRCVQEWIVLFHAQEDITGPLRC